MPQAGIRAHSGTVQRLVGPVDLARFDSTVKVPTEGSGRTSRHPGRRVPVRSLCDGPGVHSAGSRALSDPVGSRGCRTVASILDAGVPLRDVQIAARHADPRTTTVYDRRRQNYDRHAAYAVVAFVTNG